MPNHYHFLVRQDGEETISRFVQALFNSYTKAFNRRFRRSGTLFEGPFRAVAVEDEGYLLRLCRYIHLNPVRARLAASPEGWPFSNYREWVGLRNGTLVDRAFVRKWFPAPEDYRRFVLEGLE